MRKDEFTHFGFVPLPVQTSCSCVDYNEESSVAPRFFGVISVQCFFKAFKYLVTIMQGFCCGLEGHGAFSYFVVAEIIGIASGRYNQIVVA